MHIHHTALIVSDYARSKRFYTETLGLEILAEHYRAARDSWKLDLGLNGQYVVELFSFPNPPPRPGSTDGTPEACGLRHLLAHPGQTFDRDQLLNTLWDHPDHIDNRTVDSHIKTLRQKLRAIAPDADPIRTRRGYGYHLEP